MIELIHPFESPSGNAFHKRHWSVYAKWKKQCVQWAVLAARGNGIDGARGKRHVRFIVYRKRMIDDDNMIQGVKALRDALVEVGLLINDSPKWATFQYDQRPAKTSKIGTPHTTIIITDIATIDLKPQTLPMRAKR